MSRLRVKRFSDVPGLARNLNTTAGDFRSTNKLPATNRNSSRLSNNSAVRWSYWWEEKLWRASMTWKVQLSVLLVLRRSATFGKISFQHSHTSLTSEPHRLPPCSRFIESANALKNFSYLRFRFFIELFSCFKVSKAFSFFGLFSIYRYFCLSWVISDSICRTVLKWKSLGEADLQVDFLGFCFFCSYSFVCSSTICR